MNVGVLLIGISSGFGRDFTHCASNIKTNIIEPLKKEHDVNIVLTSYKSDSNKELIDTYSPCKYTFLDFNDSHQIQTYILGLESSLDIDLDFVICTRFDIHFHKSIVDIPIDYTKFNALFKEKGWWNNNHFTTDNFFAFPQNMTTKFIDVLHDMYKNPARYRMTDLHQAFYRVSKLIGEENSHIVSNIEELSNYNSFYSLCNQKWGICS